MKLTETQIKVLDQIIKDFNRAKNNLDNALLLIVGKTFEKFTIKDGELIIDDKPDDPK